ncbi:MAG: CDGSH iron-sulfur domain-containing protein [Balneolaceae bacterium]
MKEKILTYKGEKIKVTYDVNRCIHAAECTGGLPSVFNADAKPWVQPDNDAADNIAGTIHKCPTGALQYERLDGSQNEKPPSKNRISLDKNGPVYFHGDIQLQDAEGNIILEDTRFALCRCGASKNKPACDNSHKKIKFKAPETSGSERFPQTEKSSHGKLILKVMKNGPVLVEGTCEIQTDKNKFYQTEKNMALCRCGASNNKPFCDGTHKDIGFEAS